VFEIMGENLLSLIKYYEYNGIPLGAVKVISRQICTGLDYVHQKCGLIHTDLKPENVLLCLPPRDYQRLQQLAKQAYEQRLAMVDADDGEDTEAEDAAAGGGEAARQRTSAAAGRSTARELQAALAAITKPQYETWSPSDYHVKIVDLGNACWVDRHFTSDIQTRQYRSPEVILGAPYDTAADMWSLGCMVFELATGDLLFDPHSGEAFDRDDDHLALFMELLGRMSRQVTSRGKYANDFFTRKGDLKRIRKLKYWSMADVLTEKYDFTPDDALATAAFILPCLEFVPERRSSAGACLSSPWVAGAGVSSRPGPAPPSPMVVADVANRWGGFVLSLVRFELLLRLQFLRLAVRVEWPA
jgi:serine/threonine-protein kinase SRPK3